MTTKTINYNRHFQQISEAAAVEDTQVIDQLLKFFLEKKIDLEKVIAYCDWYYRFGEKSQKAIALIKRRSRCKCGQRAASWDPNPECPNCGFHRKLREFLG